MAIQSPAQPTLGFTGAGIETGEQGLYHLPRDHAFHGGPTYFTNDFFEWHYFTFLGRDKTTGHDVSLFWIAMSQGWAAQLNRPVMFSFFAWHDKVTGEFFPTTMVPMSAFESSGSREPDFGFQYAIKDPDEKGFEVSYAHAQERWTFKAFCSEKSKLANGKPYLMDVVADVKAPGYIPSAYWGLESIGFNPLFNQNPETMYGLTYYYTAPEMEMKGTVTLPDGEHEIEGAAWFEHQWGNFRNTEQARYFWGYARFDNGDTITWRQYYGNPVGKLTVDEPFDTAAARKAWNEPHPEVTRFAFIPKGQAPQYAFGPSFVYTPTKWWTSPESGAEYPWWGEMKTPKGTFYLSPTFPAQETASLAGPFIEGALLLRADSIDGPVVAHGFCELVQLPALGAPFTRGLPERTDLQFNGGLKRD
jgi:hypothetical protein